MKMVLRVASLLLMILSSSLPAVAGELSQSELRAHLLRSLQRDFVTHVNSSGLKQYVRGNTVPMTVIDREFRDIVDERFDFPLSRLEAKLLVRYPNYIPRVKLTHKMSYAVTEMICADTEAEGNETDSARHFIGAFALALLTSEQFAYKYLTAHEGWVLDQNLDEYTGYNFASGFMDLHNNVIGIIAARKYQKSFKVLNLEVELHSYSIEQIKRLAVRELKEAREQNKLIAVYAKDGACAQLSQRDNLRRRLGLSTTTAIY